MTNKLKINLLLSLTIIVSGIFMLPKVVQAVASGPTTIVGYCQTQPKNRIFWLDKGGNVPADWTTHGDYVLYRKVSTNGGATYGGWAVISGKVNTGIIRTGGMIGISADTYIQYNNWYRYVVAARTSSGWRNSNVITIPATAEHCGLPAAPEMTVTCVGSGASRQMVIDWTIARNAKLNVVRKRRLTGGWEQPDKVWEFGPLPNTNLVGPGPGFQITRWVDTNPPTTGQWAYQVKSDVPVAAQVSGTIDQICAAGNQLPKGWLDVANCTMIAGWTYDPDIPNQSIAVHLYVDGAFYRAITTTGLRQDVNNAFGITGNHGYGILTPNDLKDGSTHLIQAYAIDDEGINPQLSGSPKTMPACAPPNEPPTGNHQTATCTNTTGWAKDPNTSSPINVKFFRDGAANSGGVQVGTTLANKPNASAGGNYGFDWLIPASFKDGASHTLYAYATDSTSGTNYPISNTPKNITCVTWNISVSANPSSGTAPSFDSVITARKAAGSTATGSTAWTFNCGDGGGDVTKPTASGVDQSTYTCTYNSQGTYTATVSAVRVGLTDTDSVSINVAAPEKPTVVLDILTEPDYCTSPLGITANWTYGHSTDPQKYYRIQIDDNSDFSSPLFDTGMLESSTDSKSIMSGSNPLYIESGDMLYGSTLYYVRARVRIVDRSPGGVASDWSNVLTWTTPNERFPQPEFSWDPEQVIEGEEVQFTDESFPQSSVRTLDWLFGDGNSSTDKDPVHTYELDGGKSVTLTVNGACSITKDLTVKEKPPIWKEILPNLFFSAPSPGLEPGSSGPKPDVLSIILQGLFRK